MLRILTTWKICVALLLTVSSVHAEIYKWLDEKGNVYFSDQPPATNTAEAIKLPKISTYSQARVSEENVDLDDNEMTKQTSSDFKNKEVVMYSAAWCGVCVHAKNYFRKKKIKFREYDIETSKKGKRDFKKLKARGVPVILVGKQRLNGFDPQKFEALYKKTG